MTNTVKAVKREGERQGALEKDLDGERKGGSTGSQSCRAEAEAERRTSKIRNRPDVEKTRQGDTGDTVRTREVPGDLRAVDANVRRNGAVQALLRQELGRVGGLGGRNDLSICSKRALVIVRKRMRMFRA